jgi:hypothetical protein
MPSLDDRFTALEARVDGLTADSHHAIELAVSSAREALTARDAHQKNIELLNALRRNQGEQTQTLADHGRKLDEHDVRLDSIDGKLGQITVGVHAIESMLTRLVDEDNT